ncbi:MAG: hypothetical protein WC663_01115 [Patescibacteria group bacterium]|jgi:hypothetical protein
MAKQETSSFVKEITRVAYFSYEPFIQKYSFVKKYLEKYDKPREEWILYITSAGLGYALSRKEVYPNEHNELIESVSNIGGLKTLVSNFTKFRQNNKKFDSINMGFWVLSNIKKGKPTIEELEKFPADINKILDSTISEYESKRLKNKSKIKTKKYANWPI